MKIQSCLLFIAALFSSPLFLSAQDTRSSIDEIVSRYTRQDNGHALGVLVIKNGEVAYKHTWGNANVDREKCLRSSDLFHLDGLTAQFTAVAVMMLEEEDKLSLQTPVRDYLPALPAYMADLTVAHLLYHQSGLPTVPVRKLLADQAYVEASDIVHQLSRDSALLFPPGSRMDINPVNYMLLAGVIESVSACSYNTYLKKNILKPLGMKKAYVGEGQRRFWQRRPVQGYLNPTDTDRVGDPMAGRERYLGSRGVYASLDEYALFLSAYDKDLLLPASEMASAFQIRFFQPGLLKYPGKGWFLAFNQGTLYAYQSASSTGFTHIALRYPEEKITIVLLSNQAAVFKLRKTAFEILNLYSSKTFNPE